MLERLIYYFTYTFKNKVSTSFKISLFFLPTVVNVVIMIVSGNIGIEVSGGMSNESTEVNNFSSIGKSTNLNVTKDNFLIIENIVNIKMPISMNAFIVCLGNQNEISTTSSVFPL